jgi:predicted DNA-binding transcriptional regulator AlpA
MQYLTDKQLATRYGVTRVTVWRWVKEQDFPQPHRLSQNCTRWQVSEVEAWEKTRKIVAA